MRLFELNQYNYCDAATLSDVASGMARGGRRGGSVATCMSLRILARLPKKRMQCFHQRQLPLRKPDRRSDAWQARSGASQNWAFGPLEAQFSTSCRNRIVCHTDAVAAIILCSCFGHLTGLLRTKDAGTPSLATSDVAFSLLAYIAGTRIYS